MLNTKTKSLRNRTANAIIATLNARRRAGRRTGDPVITDGIACYYDAVSGFLLLIPLDDAGTEAVVQTPISNEDANDQPKS